MYRHIVTLSRLLMTASAATCYKHESSLHIRVPPNRVFHCMCFLGPSWARGMMGSSGGSVTRSSSWAGKRRTYADMLTPYSLFQRSNFRSISGVICRLRVFAAATNASCGTYEFSDIEIKAPRRKVVSHKCCIDIFSHSN